MTFYTTFDTPFCKIILVGTKDGISRLHLDTGEGKRDFSIGDDWIRNEAIFADAKENIVAYCTGSRQRFSIPLQLHGTDFQKKVWKELQEIPYGKTISYKDQSKKMNAPKAIRAIASANGKNPIWIIIPCHRVIGSDGSLTGYAGGVWRKKWGGEHENPIHQTSLF